MKKILVLSLILLTSITLLAQYEIDPQVIRLDDLLLELEHTDLYVGNERENVRAIGMGKTQVSRTKSYNGMINNPAFLAKNRTSFEIVGLQASLPPETYDAANFLNDHISEFREALSFDEVWAGVKEFQNAANIQQQLNALRRIQQGLIFPRDLVREVIGDSENPQTHGIRLVPSFGFQIGNFGFNAYAVGQSGFEVQQNPIVDQLLDIYIPDDLNDPQQVAQAIESIAGILNTVVDANGDIDTEILPVAYSLSYIDIVGAAGYGMKITPSFGIGANLKVINRRFSAKRIVIDDYDVVLNVLKKDFESSKTGFTFDLGLHYEFDFGLDLGLSALNIIPTQEITSTLKADIPVSYYDYKRDQNGNIIINANGDTVINAVTQNVDLRWPFDLRLPMLLNFGASYSIYDNWSVAFEIADIAEQDSRYEYYENRIRLGTEYFLETSSKFGAAFRIGLADSRPTFGIGLNLFRVLQLDAAYAYDSYVSAYSYFAQVRIGW